MDAPLSYDAEAPFQLRSRLPQQAGGGPESRLARWASAPHTHPFSGSLIPRECLACEGLYGTDLFPSFSGAAYHDPANHIVFSFGGRRMEASRA